MWTYYYIRRSQRHLLAGIENSRLNAFIVIRCKESIENFLFCPPIFLIHDIFHLDARAVELIRGCVAIFIMAYIYCPSWIFKLTKIPKLFDDSFPYSLKPDLNRIIRAKIISNYAYSNFVSQDSQVLYSSSTIKFDFVKESVTLNFASHSSGMVSIFFCLWFSVYQRLFSTLSSYFRVKKINK